ncbi:carboxylating nicotinate-nucleotide diphosphorylase [Saccharicrinis fermentans]|uniref:Probable nicotinate-nucleotide pyrophosphorylase [carboxylating] n=1 Tax=Saccharicrinis fermentans DSM 9555 = JCM 21142 TaxID=869213 RepID=W7YAW3_9BACT|nr:carboxylating nicotinate-nucleotide diphosphorylase [Saccharicrinis fermentans]GAF01501.1 nicotinate-nucleotide pyrophosphorylase [Saccharicrinis fermentans DSM 9555 = JCM 21142]
MIKEEVLNGIIDKAIREDVGDGDHSSQACIPKTALGKAQLLVKEEGIIAGVDIAQKVFRKFDPNMAIEVFVTDGAVVKPGDIVFKIEGKVLDILKAERLVLNIMQRMSGIATRTNIYVQKLAGLKTKVLDTRKTTPGLRELEKLAVKIGGGVNHRMGLFDMIMLKDNHIDYAGGIEKAIGAVHQYLKEKGKDLKIEVEVRDFAELEEVMRVGGIHRIMLDNFSPQDTQKAVELINGKFETESSGGITLDTLRSYAECGVDFISVGALTHHIKSLDLSLKAL